MQRREFITLVGGAVAGWPLSARAQQPALPVVGFLNSESADSGYGRMAEMFTEGLKEVGYVDGQNVKIEYHWADGHNDRLPTIVDDLIRRRVAVIAATTTPAAEAAKMAATTVPVVFETGGDPVQLGLVGSLNHPGGNITGVSQSNQEVAPKRLEFLREVFPSAKFFAVLSNTSNAANFASVSVPMRKAAESLGVELRFIDAMNENAIDKAFANAVEMHAPALAISDDPFLTSHTSQLGALAARHGIAAIYKGREFVSAGGLMSYGTVVGDTYRLAGVYVGRVLKGDKPGDLPVQRASKVELYINLKSAKALGITIPLPLSGRADEVIE